MRLIAAGYRFHRDQPGLSGCSDSAKLHPTKNNSLGPRQFRGEIVNREEVLKYLTHSRRDTIEVGKLHAEILRIFGVSQGGASGPPV
jgi:hypothetical protein